MNLCTSQIDVYIKKWHKLKIICKKLCHGSAMLLYIKVKRIKDNNKYIG